MRKRLVGKSWLWMAVIVLVVAGCMPPPYLGDAPDAAKTPAAGDLGLAGIGDTYYPGLGNGGYDVSHYTIVLAVDPEANTLQGSTTIEATASEDLTAFYLDSLGWISTGHGRWRPLDCAAAGRAAHRIAPPAAQHSCRWVSRADAGRGGHIVDVLPDRRPDRAQRRHQRLLFNAPSWYPSTITARPYLPLRDPVPQPWSRPTAGGG